MISAIAARRLIQRPMPRFVTAKYVSGTDKRRMRTKIVASEPSPSSTRLSGTVAGSAIPASRRASRMSVASPMKKTSFPSGPVCHPLTDSVNPSAWLPAYQSVNAEIARTRPATQAIRSPQSPAAGRGGALCARAGGEERKRETGSGVCTVAVWGKSGSGVWTWRLGRWRPRNLQGSRSRRSRIPATST
jgi:hypothetical protein